MRQTRWMADLGYDDDFLGTTLAPPLVPDGDGGHRLELAYTHFTLRMHPTRRLAAWVAWNIDGLTLFPSDSISRSGERFTLDPRLPGRPADRRGGLRRQRPRPGSHRPSLGPAVGLVARRGEASQLGLVPLHQHHPAAPGLQPVRARRGVGTARERRPGAGGARRPSPHPVRRPRARRGRPALPRHRAAAGRALEGRGLPPRRPGEVPRLPPDPGPRRPRRAVDAGLPRGLRHLPGAARAPRGPHRARRSPACATSAPTPGEAWPGRGWSPTSSRSAGRHVPRRWHAAPGSGTLAS